MAIPRVKKTTTSIFSIAGGSRLGQKPKGDLKISKTTTVTILIAVIILVYLIISYTPLNPYLLIKFPTSKWQAVFLNNNQVYFGKIVRMSRKEIALKNIYYLQTVTQPLQQSQGMQAPSQQAEQKLTLVKLGNELHGPEDEMVINRNYIILIENLKNDSKVVKAIERYLSDQEAQ